MPRQPRALTMFVLACALFLRVAVPAGWMPSTTDGAFAIEPCVAAAPVMANHEGAHHGPKGKAQHAGECSFAPFQASVAEAASTAEVPATALADAALPQQRLVDRPFARGPPALPPPATGPPAIA